MANACVCCLGGVNAFGLVSVRRSGCLTLIEKMGGERVYVLSVDIEMGVEEWRWNGMA